MKETKKELEEKQVSKVLQESRERSASKRSEGNTSRCLDRSIFLS